MGRGQAMDERPGFTNVFGEQRGTSRSHKRQAEEHLQLLAIQVETSPIEEAVAIYNNACNDRNLFSLDLGVLRLALVRAATAEAISIDWVTKRVLKPDTNSCWKISANHLVSTCGTSTIPYGGSSEPWMPGYPKGFDVSLVIQAVNEEMLKEPTSRLEIRLLVDKLMITHLREAIVQEQTKDSGWIRKVALTINDDRFWNSEKVVEKGGFVELAKTLNQEDLSEAIKAVAYYPTFSRDPEEYSRAWGRMPLKRGTVPNASLLRVNYYKALRNIIEKRWSLEAANNAN